MRRRYDQLDGLRGVAALMVVLAHYVLAFQPAMYFGTIGGTRVSFAAAPGIAGSPLTLLFQPELAVAVFFVLSGFVLAAGVEVRPAPLAELALRRWLRLSIPVLATSIAVWAMLRTGLHADRRLVAINHSSWLDMNFVWLAWESNDLRTVIFQALIDVYVRGRHWWNTALWTMPIEFWGSLGLFAAYAALRRLRAASGWRLATAAGAFVVLWHTPYASFAAGAGIYELCRCDTRGGEAWIAGAVLWAIAIVLGSMPYFGLRSGPHAWAEAALSPVAANPVLAAHRLAAIALVAGGLVWPPAQRALASAPCRFLGRVSFMTYLIHTALLCSFASWTVLRLMPWVGYNAATVLGLPVLLAALLPIAALATRLIDRPGTVFAHRAAHAVAVWVRGRRLAMAAVSVPRSGR